MFMGTRKGFTLAELMVAILILGILAAIVVPLVRPKSPSVIRETFILQLNSLVSFAVQNAIVTGKINNIFFNFSNKTITACVGSGNDVEGKQQIKSAYTTTRIKIPDQLKLRNFYIEGIDEMGRYAGGLLDTYFYVIPDGFAQPVVINMVDIEDKVGRRNRHVGLILNPFSAQFEVYHEFKNP